MKWNISKIVLLGVFEDLKSFTRMKIVTFEYLLFLSYLLITANSTVASVNTTTASIATTYPASGINTGAAPSGNITTPVPPTTYNVTYTLTLPYSAAAATSKLSAFVVATSLTMKVDASQVVVSFVDVSNSRRMLYYRRELGSTSSTYAYITISKIPSIFVAQNVAGSIITSSNDGVYRQQLLNTGFFPTSASASLTLSYTPLIASSTGSTVSTSNENNKKTKKCS